MPLPLNLFLIHSADDECFDYDVPGYPTIFYDVTRAKLMIARGEGFVALSPPITPDVLASIAEKHEFDEAKIDAADPSVPGIAAPIVIKGRIQYALIDGTHRAVKALRTGAEFRAYLLTDDATRSLVHAEGKALELIP